MSAQRLRAIAIHDVEPTTFGRAVEIREWLGDRGVARATLLVIPAAELRPFGHRSPDLADWLLDCIDAGDSVAQHGLTHRSRVAAHGPRRWLAHLQGGASAEFPGLDEAMTRRALKLGRSILEDAGLPTTGFVAPAYAYTPSLRRALAEEYDWWASLMSVHCPGGSRLAPACCLGNTGAVRSALAPAVATCVGRASRRLVRIDVHPADFDRAGHVRALERLLDGSAGRDSVPYDEALAG